MDTDRKRWLETLLDRMSAPADVMRQHLGEADQNAHLGAAAETGVRDLLRLVLPPRLAVTSGFLRETGQSLAGVGAVGPQTDVIVYDGLDAIPLHSIGGVDVVAATDALGVFEVKDTNTGSGELVLPTSRRDKGETGAIEHIASVGALAPAAFRAIVLFRGLGGSKKAEYRRAASFLTKAALKHDRVPHVVYCASCPTPGGTAGSYFAHYNDRAREVRVHQYLHDRVGALASFLRVTTGYFAVRGLISPALHLDLFAANADDTACVRVPGATAGNLHARLVEQRKARPPAAWDALLIKLLREHKGKATTRVASGCDSSNLPTAGFVITVTLDQAPTTRETATEPIVLEAFFYLFEPDKYGSFERTAGSFKCTEGDERDPWTIEDEPFGAYIRRVNREADREGAESVAPGKNMMPYDEESRS